MTSNKISECVDFSEIGVVIGVVLGGYYNDKVRKVIPTFLLNVNVKIIDNILEEPKPYTTVWGLSGSEWFVTWFWFC